MPKIAFIGGGSCKFVQSAVADLLQYEELQGSRITLMDVDPQRLARAEQLTRLMIRERGAAMTVQATTDQRAAVAGADYVFLTVMVGGMRHYQSDTTISARHGVFEAAGDTTGPGAVFRLVRTAPVLRELVRNLRETAPDAWVLSYVNPMAMVTRALHELGHPKTLGLCHSVEGSVKVIAEWLTLPADEIEYTAAGINHLCFYLTLKHRGRDLYPDLRANAARIIREAAAWEADTWQQERRGYECVRMALLEHLGYLPAEGPWHQGEYYPWFRKTAALLETYGPPTGWAYEFDKKLSAAWEEKLQQMIAGTKPLAVDHAWAPGVHIIHALETGRLLKTYINVSNAGVIGNLPQRAVVEVPCLVSAAGVAPCHVGDLPPQLAAVMSAHIFQHQLALDGVIHKDRVRIRQAIQADPLTGAALTLPQITALVDELGRENVKYLRDYT